VRRRDLIKAVIGSVVALQDAAGAQQSQRLRRIGILMPYPPRDAVFQERVRAFREELRKRGWASGVNVEFDERWVGDNMDLIRSAASNLVELKPDVVLATGGRVIPILMELTRTVPIVIPGAPDPVERGYVKSLAHPGGNVTGFSQTELSVIGKMLQILKEVAPQVSRVSMMFNPDNPATALIARAFESAAAALGIEPTIAHVHGLTDIESAVAAAAAKPNSAIFVVSDVTINALPNQTVEAVARHRVPAVYSERNFATIGGLLYYGTDRIELFRRAASYVDRILRGEKPGDLPYEGPTKYDLVINLKTAKALGWTIPPKLLFTADEVIE
jgi:putative ABC transport system substrate-binding protein